MQILKLVFLVSIIYLTTTFIFNVKQANCMEEIESTKKIIVLINRLSSKTNQLGKRTKRYLGSPIASPNYWFDMTQRSGYVFPFFFGRKAEDTSKSNQTHSMFTYYLENFNKLFYNG